MPRLTEEQWRIAFDLADAAADLPPQGRRSFLESSGAGAEILEQARLLLAGFNPEAESPDRVGSSIGRFVIMEYCGSGGVGDVYRAHDTELDRIVALKFLRPLALKQPGAVDRFIREARTVSALNHSHIVTVHEVLRSGDELAIVMEFVEGTPLRVLCNSPLPLKQVIAIGRQIALALEAAHQRGIVHRDIKPENAILRPDGSIKVLDFGLATSLSVRRDGEAALSASHLFAGTWRYMSPEQGRGEPVSTATDIFSLGLVLGELLSGCPPGRELPPFTSSNQDPTPVPLPAPSVTKISLRLRPLLRSMLAESPTQRPSAAAVSDRLADIERSLSSKSHRWFALVASVASLICVSILIYFLLQNRVPGPLLASAISVEPGEKFALAFSSDGSRLAYGWDREGMSRQIYVQSIDERTGAASPPTRLTQSSASEDLPAWSPDGKQIAFTRARGVGHWDIILRDLSTGHERILTYFAGRSITWTGDGKWLLTTSADYPGHTVGLISLQDGSHHSLTASDGKEEDERPTSTPDSRAAIFARFFSDYKSQLATVPLRPDRAARTQPAFLSWPDFHARLVLNPVYSSDGRDLFLVAQMDGIRRLYRSHSGQTPMLLASLGERTNELAIPAHRNRLAFLRNLDDTNIWKLQLKATGSFPASRTTRIITSSRMDQRPAISPDGSQIAFESDRNGYPEIWLTNLATGETAPLTALRSQSGSPRWSPDGRWVVFDGRIENSSSVFQVSVDGGQPQRLTVAAMAADQLPVVSPDGQWIYFASNRSGHFQIWRVPSHGGAATLQVESDSTAPELSPDGRFLYYLEKFWTPSRLWRKDLLTGQTSSVADQVFFRGYAVGKNAVYITQKVGRDLKLFSVTPDGRHCHFLTILPSSTVGGFSINQREDTLYFAQLESSGDEILLVNRF